MSDEKKKGDDFSKNSFGWETKRKWSTENTEALQTVAMEKLHKNFFQMICPCKHVPVCCHSASATACQCLVLCSYGLTFFVFISAAAGEKI